MAQTGDSVDMVWFDEDGSWSDAIDKFENQDGRKISPIELGVTFRPSSKRDSSRGVLLGF